MRLLFVYTEFLNQDGTKKLHRGFSHLALNFSTDRQFIYQDGKLTVMLRQCPIPPNFFGDRIYNVTTLIGDNGAGKTTILHYLIKLLQQFYEGQYRGNDRGLVVVEDRGKTYVFDYYGKYRFCLKEVPDGIEYVQDRNKNGFLSATKLIYLANTLTYSDLGLVRQQPKETHDQYVNFYHFRQEFLYNCSTASLIVENCQNDSGKPLGSAIEYLNCFFYYEQYKQVKYVFDERQYEILDELRKEGYPVPVPEKLFVELQCVDYFDAYNEHFEGFEHGHLNFETWEDCLLYELCCSCVESFTKTVILYSENANYNQHRDVLKRVQWKMVSSKNINNYKEMFLEMLIQVHKAYRTEYPVEANESLIQALQECCSDFITFLFSERNNLQNYFEISLIQKQTINFSISTTGDAAIWFIKFLKKYRYTCEPYYYLEFSWGLSSGEQNLLRLFSSLYYVFSADYTNPERGDYKIYNGEPDRRKSCDSLMLWLDEADLTYHPEWQRRFLSILTAFLPKIYPDTCCHDMQVLLTTHSPLMLGDSPAQSVIYLSKDATGHVTVDDSGTRQTFGENLYMLLQNSFAVKDGAIGVIVQNKIQEILETLKEVDQELNTWSEVEEVSLSKVHNRQTQRQDQLQGYKEGTVAFLADGIIKDKLEAEINYRLQQLEKYALTSKDERNPNLDEMSNTQLERQIKVLSDELKRRKGEYQ